MWKRKRERICNAGRGIERESYAQRMDAFWKEYAELREKSAIPIELPQAERLRQATNARIVVNCLMRKYSVIIPFAFPIDGLYKDMRY